MDFSNKTALVTGASSGIGLAYAQELAKRGCNLILVARRLEMLEKAKAELSGAFGVKVTVIAQDLSSPTGAEALVKKLASLKQSPDIVINNAGFGTNNRVADENAERVQQEIMLNIGTLVALTQAYLPAMLKNNSGVIVNIGSTASFQPVPGMAVYAATKAFVRSFTSAVWGEVQGTKVKVLTVNPGATATEFFEVAKANPFGRLAPSSAVVDATFAALAAKQTPPSIIVGAKNRVMAKASSFIPQKSVIKVAGSMFLHKNKN